MAKTNSTNKTITLVLDRETKGALRYQEVGPEGNPRQSDADGALCGTIYFRKAAMDGKPPKGLKVTIEEFS